MVVLSPFIPIYLFVILTDSSTGSPVHVLMLSIQAVRGLPRLRALGIVPCSISFSRQLSCFLVDFTEARDSEWQWRQLGHMQVCTSLQTTTPAPRHSVFYRPDALPAAQPTASKH